MKRREKSDERNPNQHKIIGSTYLFHFLDVFGLLRVAPAADLGLGVEKIRHPALPHVGDAQGPVGGDRAESLVDDLHDDWLVGRRGIVRAVPVYGLSRPPFRPLTTRIGRRPF